MYESGEQQLLTQDDVIYLATTSGTTGRSKVMPVTKWLKKVPSLRYGSIMHHLYHRCAVLDLQRTCVLSYSAVTEQTACGLLKGPVSQHMYRYFPFLLTPQEVYRLTNEQQALHAHAVFALQDPHIGRLEALMSTLVLSFWLYVECHWQQICDDIEHGVISISHATDSSTNLYDDIKQALGKRLLPNPQRALFLRQEFSRGFHGIARRIWPNLRTVRMLATGAFAHAAAILRDRQMTQVTQMSLLHVSSEAFMGINLLPTTASGSEDEHVYAATIDVTVLEYIPESHLHDTSPATVLPEEVEFYRCH